MLFSNIKTLNQPTKPTHLFKAGVQLLDHLLENIQGKTLLLFCPEHLCFFQMPLRDATNSWIILLYFKYCSFRELQWKWHMEINTITTKIKNQSSNYHSQRTSLFVRNYLNWLPVYLPNWRPENLPMHGSCVYNYVKLLFYYLYFIAGWVSSHFINRKLELRKGNCLANVKFRFLSNSNMEVLFWFSPQYWGFDPTALLMLGKQTRYHRTTVPALFYAFKTGPVRLFKLTLNSFSCPSRL